MKKIKILLLIFIILLIILITILFTINQKSKEETINTEPNTSYEIYEDYEIISPNEYLIIKNALNIYLDTLNTDNSKYYGRNENNEFVKKVTEEEIKRNICDLISKMYMYNNNVTEDQIFNYVDTVTTKYAVIPLEIIKKTSSKETVKSYGVKLLTIESDNKNNTNEMFLIVNIDTLNQTFSIEPLKSMEEIEQIRIRKGQQGIEKNSNNKYYTENITAQRMAQEYFSNYKNILLARPDIAYELLDEEYKEKRFPNINSFKEYYERNKEIIQKMRLEQYSSEFYYQSENDLEGCTQYVCVDQYQNSYIFIEENTINYRVILDLYTTDVPQFIKSYDNANIQEKVLLNIEKIKQALNSGDYIYIYSKLAQSFKDNKYKTEEDFENYIKTALYDHIEIEYKDFLNEGETYIYNLTIKNALNKSDKGIDMQIIMQLKDNRDFVMSFSIK